VQGFVGWKQRVSARIDCSLGMLIIVIG